jgi:hypothetical protein
MRYDFYIDNSYSFRSIESWRQEKTMSTSCEEKSEKNTIKLIGWASLALGVAAIGILVGRELRHRYKFNKRTPYDFYAQAGSAVTTEYGLGV